MGQLIEVEPLIMGEVAIFDTDRSFSGQDGETFTSEENATAAGTYPGLVAAALLAHDDAVNSVYVYSNAISARRRGEWSADQAEAAAIVIRNFLVHYEENRD